jgi:hypothetical protein
MKRIIASAVVILIMFALMSGCAKTTGDAFKAGRGDTQSAYEKGGAQSGGGSGFGGK